MADDIIKVALMRFQSIVEESGFHARNASGVSETDKRLARLAIKKYNRLVEWRMGHTLSSQSEKKEVLRDAAI